MYLTHSTVKANTVVLVFSQSKKNMHYSHFFIESSDFQYLYLDKVTRQTAVFGFSNFIRLYMSTGQLYLHYICAKESKVVLKNVFFVGDNSKIVLNSRFSVIVQWNSSNLLQNYS